jgi:hypothetical protein
MVRGERPAGKEDQVKRWGKSYGRIQAKMRERIRRKTNSGVGLRSTLYKIQVTMGECPRRRLRSLISRRYKRSIAGRFESKILHIVRSVRKSSRRPEADEEVALSKFN